MQNRYAENIRTQKIATADENRWFFNFYTLFFFKRTSRPDLIDIQDEFWTKLDDEKTFA